MPYAKAFTPDLVESIDSVEFRNLMEIGYVVVPQGLDQYFNGQLILTFPTAKARMVISKVTDSLRRETDTGSSYVRTQMGQYENLYVAAFEYIAKSIDENDPRLYSKRKNEMERKKELK